MPGHISDEGCAAFMIVSAILGVGMGYMMGASDEAEAIRLARNHPAQYECVLQRRRTNDQ